MERSHEGPLIMARMASRPEANVLTGEELIQRFLAGDGSAYDEICRRYFHLAVGVARFMGAALEDCSDIGQETLTRVYAKSDQFDPSRGSLDTWIRRIARNVTIDCFRRKNPHPEVSIDGPRGEGGLTLGETLEDSGPDPFAQIESRQKSELIRRCLDRMSQAYRQILLLRFVEGRSYEEIAMILGIARGTAHTRCHRAVAALRNIAENETGAMKHQEDSQ